MTQLTTPLPLVAYGEGMRHVLVLAFLVTGVTQAQGSYALELFINDQPATWKVTEPATKEGESFTVPEGQDTVTVTFEGGNLNLNLADWDVWDYAHVLGANVQKTGDDTYTFSATLRHCDEGWEHYANVWRVSGEEVENGVRELLHPHDDEQPFTRSQANVKATGTVVLEASDNIHGAGGSTVTLDLDTFSGDRISLRYTFKNE